MPANILDKITPELPLAPSSIPLAAREDVTAIELPSLSAIVAAPASIVINILSPVSPSGIGNTFRSLTVLMFSLNLAAPLLIIFAYKAPSIDFVLIEPS
jgi:hypothetical protein